MTGKLTLEVLGALIKAEFSASTREPVRKRASALKIESERLMAEAQTKAAEADALAAEAHQLDEDYEGAADVLEREWNLDREAFDRMVATRLAALGGAEIDAPGTSPSDKAEVPVAKSEASAAAVKSPTVMAEAGKTSEALVTTQIEASTSVVAGEFAPPVTVEAPSSHGSAQPVAAEVVSGVAEASPDAKSRKDAAVARRPTRPHKAVEAAKPESVVTMTPEPVVASREADAVETTAPEVTEIPVVVEAAPSTVQEVTPETTSAVEASAASVSQSETEVVWDDEPGAADSEPVSATTVEVTPEIPQEATQTIGPAAAEVEPVVALDAEDSVEAHVDSAPTVASTPLAGEAAAAGSPGAPSLRRNVRRPGVAATSTAPVTAPVDAVAAVAPSPVVKPVAPAVPADSLMPDFL